MKVSVLDPRRRHPEPRPASPVLHTIVLDLPSLLAAMKALGWSFADLAREARLGEQHVRDVVAGRVFNARTVRALQIAVNAALATSRSA